MKSEKKSRREKQQYFQAAREDSEGQIITSSFDPRRHVRSALLQRRIRKIPQEKHFRHFLFRTDGVFCTFFGKEDRGTGNISHDRASRRRLAALMQELEGYRRNGVALYLDGAPSTPGSIARACQIAEGCGYMRDYTEDEKGRIRSVDFTPVFEELRRRK